jgi:hypothetical protein
MSKKNKELLLQVMYLPLAIAYVLAYGLVELYQYISGKIRGKS